MSIRFVAAMVAGCRRGMVDRLGGVIAEMKD